MLLTVLGFCVIACTVDASVSSRTVNVDVRKCWEKKFQLWTERPHSREIFHRVASARVLVADYTLLRQDFPQLSSLTRNQINSWLLDHLAFISSNQLKVFSFVFLISNLTCDFNQGQGIVSTSIETNGTTKALAAVRPIAYNRAALFSARDPLHSEDISPNKQWKNAPWFDVKGVNIFVRSIIH